MGGWRRVVDRKSSKSEEARPAIGTEYLGDDASVKLLLPCQQVDLAERAV